MEKAKKDRFKKTIKFLESSGGRNLAHAPIETGINAGQVAGGAYGILPNSLVDFVKQSRNRGLNIDPRLVELSQLPPEEITKRLNEDRGLDDLAADLGSQLLLQKTMGDEEKAAYGWRTGHNRPFNKLSPDEYQKHPYVEAYNKEKILQAPEPAAPVAEQPIEDEDTTFSKLRKFFGQ
jgi:hypothetical protein